ncbi:MAG: M48 family metallopeptidase [Verrucomicrobia bacterium]|nr:M48 family metallopeptidase [Verrucomicrobiota bacterium]MCH8510785.1 M48 family metallopeptidase [Kiritimatiellia bacterium]
MQSLQTLQARWHDGVTLQPRTVSLRVSEDGLHGEDAQIFHAFLSWRDLRNGERVDDEIRFNIPKREERAPDGLLVLPVEPFFAALSALPDAKRTEITRTLKLKQHPRLKFWLLAAIITIPLMWMVYTRAAPMAHVFVSTEQEARLGRSVSAQLKRIHGVYEHPQRQAMLEELVRELQPPDSPYTYHITLLDSRQINALAAPGGEILFLRGLLEQIDDREELAGILAHEMAHVELRHGLKQVLRSVGVMAFMSGAIGGGFETLEALEAATELSGLLVLFSYSREAETEADAWAVERLHASGQSASGLLRFFERLQRISGSDESAWPTFLSTHPQTRERLEKLREAVASE